MKKKTTTQFKKELFELYGDEFELLEDYVTNNTKIKFRHKKCGEVIEKSPVKLLSGEGCQICNGKYRKSTTYFKKEIFNKYEDEFEIIGEYVKSRQPLEVRHKKCKKTFLISPDNLLRGKGCPHCKNFKSHEEFESDLKAIYGDKYILLEEYKGVVKEIQLYCKVHKMRFKKTGQSLMHGQACPMCFKRRLKTLEEYKLELHNIYGDEYEVIGEYKGNHHKIEVRHNCGFEYKATPYKLLGLSNRCPLCERNLSKYAKTVKCFLDKNNIRYTTEYRFPDCKYISQLPFDFYLFDFNVCIEVDGEFHFEPSRFSNAEEKFKGRKTRDKIKNEYCEKNNIQLIRLPYFEWDLFEQTLAQELNINTEITI